MLEGIRAEIEQHVTLKPLKPRSRRLIYADASKRALVDALAGDCESIAFMTDEGSIVLDSDVIRESGILNRAWDGSTLTLDRANETSVVARKPRMTISIMVQPDVFVKYLDKQSNVARGSGFLARFLVARPTSTKGFRFIQKMEPPTWGHLAAFHERLRDILNSPTNGEGGSARRVINLDDDATARWIDYANGVEAAMQPGGYCNDISDFASKAMENVARVAALFHYFTKLEGRITLDTLDRAYAVVLYHVNEAKRLFSDECAMSELATDCHRLEQYLRRMYCAGYYLLRRNDIYRKGPVRNKGRFFMAIDLLCRQNKILILVGRNKTLFVQPNPQYFGAQLSH